MDRHKAQGVERESSECPTIRAKVRLLIVDDEPALRDIASEVLTLEGYDVLTAEDGSDALRLLSEPLPDVIITDLNMPGMSGVKFLEVVRLRFPQLPVIVISAQFIRNEAPAGMLADAFLSKGSYTHHELCAKIRELIAASQTRHLHPGAIGRSPLPES